MVFFFLSVSNPGQEQCAACFNGSVALPSTNICKMCGAGVNAFLWIPDDRGRVISSNWWAGQVIYFLLLARTLCRFLKLYLCVTGRSYWILSGYAPRTHAIKNSEMPPELNDFVGLILDNDFVRQMNHLYACAKYVVQNNSFLVSHQIDSL